MTQNHRFYLSDCEDKYDADILSEAVSKDELTALQKEARSLLGEQVFRSCWQCNHCHYHFLEEKDFFLMCWMCDRFYYKGVDVTEYEEK